MTREATKSSLVSLLEQSDSRNEVVAQCAVALMRDEREAITLTDCDAAHIKRIHGHRINNARRRGITILGGEQLMNQLESYDMNDVTLFRTENDDYDFVVFADPELSRVIACIGIGKALERTSTDFV